MADSKPVYRADLSNAAVSVYANAEALSIRSRPAMAKSLAVVCGLLLLFSVFVLVVQLHRPVARWLEGQPLRVNPESTLLAGVPMVLCIGLFIWLVIGWRKERGIDILKGIVVLHVPDQSPSTVSFELADLKGARLGSLGGGDAMVIISRRKHSSVWIMGGVSPSLLGPSVDLINNCVLDIEHHAFEVIPVRHAVNLPPPKTNPPTPPAVG